MNEDEKFITIPLKITKEDIKILSEELSNCESSAITFFVEEILKKTNSIAKDLMQTISEIQNVNPYCMPHCTKNNEGNLFDDVKLCNKNIER